MADVVPIVKVNGGVQGGAALTPEKEKKIKKACADFEALLTYQMLKTMRRTVPKGGLLPKTTRTDTWDMFMDQHIAEELSKRGGGLGIQKILYDRLVRNTPEIPNDSTKK